MEAQFKEHSQSTEITMIYKMSRRKSEAVDRGFNLLALLKCLAAQTGAEGAAGLGEITS